MTPRHAARARTSATPPLAMILAAAALLTLSACDGPSQACTEIGCQDLLTLTLVGPDGQAISAFQGQVTSGQQVIDVTCAAGSSGGERFECDSNKLSVRVTPGAEVALNLRDQAPGSTLAYIGAVALSPKTTQPNGPDCPPTCTQANATVRMEPTQATPPGLTR